MADAVSTQRWYCVDTARIRCALAGVSYEARLKSEKREVRSERSDER